MDPFNIANNYGVLAYDHTHIFNFAYVFDLPSPIHGNPILKGVVNGWEISSVTQWQSGAPIQPNTGETLYAQYPSSVSSATYFGTDAVPLIPALTCDPRSGLKSGQYFNPGCFTAPSFGSRGNFNWPYIKGPAYWDSDLALFKNFKITESQNVQFRFTAFNFLNHPLQQFNADGTNNDLRLNFNNHNNLAPTNINTLTTGAPKYTVGNRLVELAIKYNF